MSYDNTDEDELRLMMMHRQSFFLMNMQPDPKGFPRIDDILGLDRITIHRKRFFFGNPAHPRDEEYYEVTIDGRDYHLFRFPPSSLIAEVYPGREYGRTVIRITDDVRKALSEIDAKSHKGTNPWLLKHHLEKTEK